MTKGIKHKDIGEDLSRTEFEADDSHELEGGTSFPGSPVEKDRFYRTDLHKWYIWNGTTWKYLGGVDISDADAVVGNVKSGITFYAGAEPKKTGTLVPSPEIDIQDYEMGIHTGATGTDTQFYNGSQSADYTVGTFNLSGVAAGSCVVAVAYCKATVPYPNLTKMYLYIGGVQVAVSDYWPLIRHAKMLTGYREGLSGTVLQYAKLVFDEEGTLRFFAGGVGAASVKVVI